MDDKWKRITSMVLYALLLGIPGCGMALGDLGEGRIILDWVVLGAAYFLFIGFMLGLIDARYWYIAITSSWGAVIIGAAIYLLQIGRQPFMPATVLVPVLFSLLGGYFGSAARGKIGAK